MDNTMRKIDNNIPDKITIKVKIGGEDFHDLIIDWSDGQDASSQLFNQLSSITGIPREKINLCTIYRNGYRDCVFIDNPERLFNYRRRELTKDKHNEYINDGDCFAIHASPGFHPYQSLFKAQLSLFSRETFDDQLCTESFCQHINGRAFLNRRIGIMKNPELSSKYKALLDASNAVIGTVDYEYADFRVAMNLDIHPYIRMNPRFNPQRNSCSCRTDYSRTRG